ncbi:hypothetical protein D3C72_1249740 [compost metagenome]
MAWFWLALALALLSETMASCPPERRPDTPKSTRTSEVALPACASCTLPTTAPVPGPFMLVSLFSVTALAARLMLASALALLSDTTLWPPDSDSPLTPTIVMVGLGVGAGLVWLRFATVALTLPETWVCELAMSAPALSRLVPVTAA